MATVRPRIRENYPITYPGASFVATGNGNSVQDNEALKGVRRIENGGRRDKNLAESN